MILKNCVFSSVTVQSVNSPPTPPQNVIFFYRWLTGDFSRYLSKTCFYGMLCAMANEGFVGTVHHMINCNVLL